MLLQFASIDAVGLKETTTTLHCYSVCFVLHLTLSLPNHHQLGPEQVGDSCRLFLIPILSCASVGACACAFCPCLTSASAIAPVPLPTIRPASLRRRLYRTALCCAVRLARASCSHQTAPICNATHGRSTPRHVNSAVPVSILQGCSKQHHAARLTTAPQDCHVRCHPVLPLAKPSAGFSLATRHRAPQLARHRLLGRQQSPRSDRPSRPAQPISGFS